MTNRPPTLTDALHQATVILVVIGLTGLPSALRAAEPGAPANTPVKGTPAAAMEPAEHAAALLSRFPEGQLPASLPVMEALTQLTLYGRADSVALLRSIAAVERPKVAAAALLALNAVQERGTLAASPPGRPGPVLACELPPRTAW